jgi:hypothetical protein
MIMFGFQGGESPETVARKKGYMEDAQQRWCFLTSYDLFTIKNEVQLRLMVKDRLGISHEQAREEVEGWMKGRDFSNDMPLPPARVEPRQSRSLDRWDGEGGAAGKNVRAQ